MAYRGLGLFKSKKWIMPCRHPSIPSCSTCCSPCASAASTSLPVRRPLCRGRERQLLQPLAVTPPRSIIGPAMHIGTSRVTRVQLLRSHALFESHEPHVQGTLSRPYALILSLTWVAPAHGPFLLRAALALQAQLILVDVHNTSEFVSGAFTSAAAAPMLKVFEAVTAAALSRPFSDGKDWALCDDPTSTSEPLGVFIDALLTNSDAHSLRMLHQEALARCGAPFCAKADIDSAWWSCPPHLMRTSGKDHGQAAPVGRGPLWPSASHAAAKALVHEHRFVAKSSIASDKQLGFAWPSHHYSSVLESWCSMRTTAANSQQVLQHFASVSRMH
jgi:hypothetical protein